MAAAAGGSAQPARNAARARGTTLAFPTDMLAFANAIALLGLDPRPVRVEVACERGPGFFEMVGLAEATVRESRVRINSALGQMGILLAEHRVAVNLAPADLRKTGAGFDLAIAAAILVALGRLPQGGLEDALLVGELSLSGALRPVRGVLPQLVGARSLGMQRAFVPDQNAREASIVQGIEIRIAKTLHDVCRQLVGEGGGELPDIARRDPGPDASTLLDLADVRGQYAGRRALEIAAAGGHNLLFIGPPGGGKTMLARRLPTVLPQLTFEEAVTVTMIHSIAGLIAPDQGLTRTPPFRSPHHTVSEAGLVGGGDSPRPGEVSLAHHGVLFLDELAEFRRGALEALRQPLEDGEVSIARARFRATFPARPILVAAVNPCPCGRAGERSGRCVCSVERVRSYRARLSGPLLDRIDLQVPLTPVDVPSLSSDRPGEPSSAVRARVVAARARQRERVEQGAVRRALNAELTSAEVERVARPDAASLRLVAQAVERFGLSARAYVRMLRVARTVADLEGAEHVAEAHVAEAIQARVLDRQNQLP